jgi:hypothetical protein
VFQRKSFEEATFGELRQRQKKERRSELRHTITLPVRVSGADRHNAPWSELAETRNVSSGGAALRLSKEVMIGDILFLELALPPRFQKSPKPSTIYRTYALVRHVEMRTVGHRIVRLKFLREAAIHAGPTTCQLVERGAARKKD